MYMYVPLKDPTLLILCNMTNANFMKLPYYRYNVDVINIGNTLGILVNHIRYMICDSGLCLSHTISVICDCILWYSWQPYYVV